MYSDLKQTLSFISSHPLGGRKKLRAYWRFFAWQVRSRISNKPHEISFVNDSRLIIERGMTGATGNLYCGLHEFEDMAFVLHYARPEDLFVDIGANVGSYSVLASAVCKCNCVTVEPVPSTFQKLKRNIELNGTTSSVELVNCGLSSNSGKLRFSTDDDTMNRVLREDEQDVPSMDVDVYQLDELLNGRAASTIKLDVEGHEIEVLNGAKVTFEQPELQAVVMEVNSMGSRYGVENASLLDFLKSYGFGFYQYSPFDRRLTELADPASGSGNVICIRDLAAAESRVKDAKPFRVLGESI